MKILLIRFSSIGDIVLTSPVIRCIKEQVANAEVHVITKNQFAFIYQNNSKVTKVYSIHKNVGEVIGSLKKENYDHIVDLHNNIRSLQLKLILNRPTSSFNKLNIEKWLLVKLRVNRLPNVHIVDRYMQAAEKLGIKNDNGGLEYFIPPADEIKMQTLPETHRSRYIAFVIGAKHFTKQLPVEKIISICKKINSAVVLIGSQEDKDKGEKIRSAVGDSIFNACGIYNLNQSASLIKNAAKVITHDTGLMHIAAAFKKEIISVWGNTVPEFGMSPYLPHPHSTIVEVKGLPCRPCSKIGYKACPKGHFKCMKNIDENVFEGL